MKCFKIKFLIVLFVISLLLREFMMISILRKKKEEKENKMIFTFWEPQENMPGYIKLCIKTWEKYFPDYKIMVLDYKSVESLIGKNLFSKIVCKSMSLPIQVDAIRVALLKIFGGIWLDADTIILSREIFKKLKGFELIMIGDEKLKNQNIGFIFADKNSYIINEWLKEIINRVKIYKYYMLKSQTSKAFNYKFKHLRAWYYLGNGILNPLAKNNSGKNIFRLNTYEINAFPEGKIFSNTSKNNIQKYRDLYFQQGDYQIILNSSKYILLLHNSWTPSEYKTMSEKEFLLQDIRLSKLLLYILNKNR